MNYKPTDELVKFQRNRSWLLVLKKIRNRLSHLKIVVVDVKLVMAAYCHLTHPPSKRVMVASFTITSNIYASYQIKIKFITHVLVKSNDVFFHIMIISEGRVDEEIFIY